MPSLLKLNRRLDPTVQDHVMVKGEREIDETPTSQVVFFITLRFNSSPMYPGMGSKFHEIQKVTEDIDVVIQQEVDRCLKPLTDAQIITDIVTTVTVTERPAADELIEVDIAFKDASGRAGAASFELSFS